MKNQGHGQDQDQGQDHGHGHGHGHGQGQGHGQHHGQGHGQGHGHGQGGTKMILTLSGNARTNKKEVVQELGKLLEKKNVPNFVFSAKRAAEELNKIIPSLLSNYGINVESNDESLVDSIYHWGIEKDKEMWSKSTKKYLDEITNSFFGTKHLFKVIIINNVSTPEDLRVVPEAMKVFLSTSELDIGPWPPNIFSSVIDVSEKEPKETALEIFEVITDKFEKAFR